jgi:hypothetical protein
MNTRWKLGLHAQTLGTELNRGAQTDDRGATQVLKICRINLNLREQFRI